MYDTVPGSHYIPAEDDDTDEETEYLEPRVTWWIEVEPEP